MRKYITKKGQEKLLKEIIISGFKVVITGIFAYPLSREWLGKTLTLKTVRELVKLKKRYGISPSGEGGEIETTVLDAPFFQKRIEVQEFEVKAKENSGVFIIKDAKLVEK